MYAYVVMATVEDYLHGLAGNEEGQMLLLKNMQSIIRILSHSKCEVSQ